MRAVRVATIREHAVMIAGRSVMTTVPGVTITVRVAKAAEGAGCTPVPVGVVRAVSARSR
jgi:hypothetical protein